MQLCSKCKKRVAVVFISKFNGEKSENEGYCLKCAHSIGLPQVDQMMKQFGISDDDLDNLSPDLEGFDLPMMTDSQEDDGKAPAINFMKLFGGVPAEQDGDTANSQEAEQEKTKGSKNKKKKFLSQFCTDLNQRVRDGKIDNIIGRDRELARLMQILCRRQKNNPCLIGEPGVGKTAVAEALAEKIVKGNVPYRLKDKEVYLVDMTAIVAGTQFRGQFETRMKGLIDEVKSLGNIILVIDEVHTIASAGDAEGSMNAANILKPALSRGEIQVIGATTLTEYRKFIEKDAALERRFQPVMIDEPSIEDCIEILRGIKVYYEDFHKIVIPDDVLERTVTLSERYITDRYLPDKAIDLLDEALSYVALNSDIIDNYNIAFGEVELLNKTIADIEAREETDPEKQQDKYRELAE